MEKTASVTSTLETVRDYIRWAASCFNQEQVYFGHGSDNAWDEAVYLVLGALHLPWDTDPTALDARLTPEERERVCELIEKRAKHRVPVAYLIKEAWFAGIPFYVDERVLVPRSPIAELIEQGFTPWLCGDEVNNILDMCTGSGCIGIACAMAFPDAQIDLADISEEALAVADINIKRHHLQGQVNTIASDLFTNVPGKKYDLIVTNPPYVDAGDLASMPGEYHHEPPLGLGSGDDGLDCIRRILRDAPDYLSEYGVLVGEVGNSCEALSEAYPSVPFLWLDLEKGGHGVFVLTAGQLLQYRDQF
ncbi:MAG: 50S ribosomal protein L3 N(5)-glutamine methyltransferase [Pseudomonadales bacterium]